MFHVKTKLSIYQYEKEAMFCLVTLFLYHFYMHFIILTSVKSQYVQTQKIRINTQTVYADYEVSINIAKIIVWRS